MCVIERSPSGGLTGADPWPCMFSDQFQLFAQYAFVVVKFSSPAVF